MLKWGWNIKMTELVNLTRFGEMRSCCHVGVIIPCLLLTVLWVDLWLEIMVFPGHAYLLFGSTEPVHEAIINNSHPHVTCGHNDRMW